MKAKFWGIYHTKNAISPRSLHFSKWDAEQQSRADWFIRRVELTIKTGTSYEICYHEYKHLTGKPKDMSKKEFDYYQNLPSKLQ